VGGETFSKQVVSLFQPR